MTTSQEALTRLIDGITDRAGNLASGSVYPDQLAPIIRNDDDGPELVKARWGMPSPPSFLKTARDPGVTKESVERKEGMARHITRHSVYVLGHLPQMLAIGHRAAAYCSGLIAYQIAW